MIVTKQGVKLCGYVPEGEQVSGVHGITVGRPVLCTRDYGHSDGFHRVDFPMLEDLLRDGYTYQPDPEPEPERKQPRPRPFADLRDSGLLWLINAAAFHPRGYALAIHYDENGDAIGWSILGDGTDPYTVPDETATQRFHDAALTLRVTNQENTS